MATIPLQVDGADALIGAVQRLLIAYEESDRVDSKCRWYGVYSKSYRGSRP